MTLVLVLCLLQDPLETLRDPLRRAKEPERKAALEAFKAREFDGPLWWAAVRFLEKGDAGWRLRYDRLTTKSGALAGKVDGSTFAAFTGERVEVSTGTLERNVADPAASGLDIYFVRYGQADLSEGDHRSALEALVAIADKTKGTSHAHDVLRVFAVVHLSALGDRADVAHAGRLGLTRVEGRWGSADQHTHAAVARGFEHPEKLAASVEATARASASFGARYAALLAKLQRTLAQRQNHEAMFQELTGAGAGGGPRGAVEHLKALAMSFKAAVYCRDCKHGKLACPQCQGKKRVNAKCPDCGGEGRLKSTGDVGAGATQRCNLCNASGQIKDSACPTCSKSGVVDCGKCAGSPWFDRACSGASCRGGKRPCSACKGKTKVDVTCKECGGGGRIKAPGDAGAGATHKCRGCEGRGTLKEAAACEACTKGSLGKGLEQCDTCGGSGRERRGAIGAGDVFSTDRCGACRGDGFPLPNVAVACPKCAGLGAIVKPVADPSKVLD